MRAISLGWGVQSFGLAAMSALGELPPVDVAIHADTTHESELTYAFEKTWTPWLQERGVKVVVVRAENTDYVEPIDGSFAVPMPVFSNKPEGDDGRLRRRCTQDWKIDPIRRWLQANRDGEQVDLLIGYTLDESTRAKDSDVGYVTNRFPFLFDLPMRRWEVGKWLTAHGLPIPPRSACVFCPNQGTERWRALAPGDFQKAVAVDEVIRHARSPYSLFLHRSRIPLRQVDLRSEQEKGQLDMFEDGCFEHCGL